jgi:ubiquinone/menaquinone biosynthesis C-methylase UbiE
LDYEYAVIEDLSGRLGQSCRLLDLGCGSLGLLARRGERLLGLHKDSLGIDIDRKNLASNQNVVHRLCASCYALPLKSHSVDIIVCRWVFEHLEHPEQAMRECSRVLKKGGFLYVKTPHLWHYTMLLSWATPTAFHNFFLSRTSGKKNTPTYYRANTRRQLERLAAETGFAINRIECYPSSFMYFVFNKELFVTMRAVSKLVGKITDRAQQTLVCVLQKVEDV